MLRQLKPDEARGKLKEEYWDSPEWIAEEKYDGVRYLMHIGERNRFTSRRKSVHDGLYVEKTLNFPHLSTLKFPKEFHDSVIDGEIIKGRDVYDVMRITGANPAQAILLQELEGYVSYVAWDILFFKGEDVRNKPLYIRKDLLCHILNEVESEHIDVSPICIEDKKNFFFKILSRGGEGVILKNMDSIYGKKSWVKVKKVQTYDVIVVGFEEPKKLTEKVDGSISISRLAEKGWRGSM